MENIKKEYGSLRKKYGLPSYDALDSEFELLYMPAIAEVKFPLRFIRRRISDKLASVCSMIQSILQPNPGSLINLQESNFFDKEQKGKIAALLKDFMQIERDSLILDFASDEKGDAAFIKENFEIWLKKKEEVRKVVAKLRSGWSEEAKSERTQYFG